MSSHTGRAAPHESVASFTCARPAVESERDAVGKHLALTLPTPACPCGGWLPVQQAMFWVRASGNLLPIFALTSRNPVNLYSAPRNQRTRTSTFAPLQSPKLSSPLSSQPFQLSLAPPGIFFSQLCELLKTVGWQSLTSHQLRTVEGSGDKNRLQWQFSFSQAVTPSVPLLLP